MGWFTLNWRLMPPKAHYFLYFGGMASFWPSITVFAKQLGVSEVAVGLLFTVAPITGLISMPLFGYVADRFKIKKKLFLVFNLINFVALMSFAFLPAQNPLRPVSLECAPGSSYITQMETIPNHIDKCNVSDIKLFEDKKVIDNCNLLCNVKEFERKTICLEFLGPVKPSFCESNTGREENDTFISEMKVKLKVYEAVVVGRVLHLPIYLVDDNRNEIGFSCDSKVVIQKCQIDCERNPPLNLRLQKVDENPDVYQSGVFWSYVFLVLVSWIAFAVVTSVADALCFQTLGDKPHLYGIQRQWGAMGWGLFSLLSGYLIDSNSKGSLIKDYSPTFYLVFILLFLNFIVCYKWNVKEEEKPHALGKSMIDLLLNPKITIFILACVVVGVCTGLLWQFLFWYAEDIASCDDMAWIKVLQGLISIVQCFGGELPFFYISSWFIKTLGHVHCMTLVLGAFGVRFLIYSFLTNPWTILPVELLQGVTYGIFYSNMASYAYVVSPPGSAATVQGIVGAAFEGIGVGAGSLLGGILYKNISGRLAFRSFGVCTLIFCAGHFVTMRFVNKRFTPLQQTDDDERYREPDKIKISEMQDMKGKKFPSVEYDSH